MTEENLGICVTKENAVYLEENPAEHESHKYRTIIILPQRETGCEICSGTMTPYS